MEKVVFFAGGIMRNKLFSVLYAVNIVSQAIFTLITPAALLFGIDFLLVKYADFPKWTYAIASPIGVLMGLVSMTRFVISATAALERLEKQDERNKKQKTGNNKDE